jgi:hypothetical protein
MTRIGILLHVYHLEALGWERLVWGDPTTDELGTGTKLIDCLLDIPPSDTVTIIIYSGPSQKDGLTEGAYTKKFLLDRLASVQDFPRLGAKLAALPEGGYEQFVQRMQMMNLGPVIKNTAAELEYAAELFQDCSKVFQIASASHAPRCLLAQITTRQNGNIPKNQPWYIVPSDICFSGTTASDVVILEPPHRGDDPMLGITPKLVDVIKPYFALPPDEKKQFIQNIVYSNTTNT